VTIRPIGVAPSVKLARAAEYSAQNLKGAEMKPGITATIGALSAVACTASLVAVAVTPASAVTAITTISPATIVASAAVDTPVTRGAVVNVVVSSIKNSGAGSLRTAIKKANKRSKSTTTNITFSTAGTIVLNSNLPAVKRKIIIDGTTAPGYVASSGPVVGLNANGYRAVRFDPGSGGSQLLGLSVTGASGNGVTLTAGRITLNYNYIGLAVDGGTRGDVGYSGAGNRGDGVYVERTSKGNKIGLNPTLTVGAVGNVISNNRGAGIRMIGSARNVIQANRIGTNAAGTAAAGNQRGGIELIGASKNKIGGNAIGSNGNGPNNPTGTKGSVAENYVAPPQGNVISGNKREGVLISAKSKGTLLSGNFIGTNAAGVKAIANSRNGVRVIDSDNTVFRGCTLTDEPFVYYNVISGNKRNGIHVTNSDKTVVQANFFGIGMDNTTKVPNKLNGMLFDGNSKKPHVGGVIPLGNVAAGNGKNGIAVKGTVSGFITFNTFGGLLAFKGAAPNRQNGLYVSSTGGNNFARTNVFSGNAGNGVLITGNARGMTLDPNIVGLNTNGNSPLRNGGNGVVVSGNARGNTIGGNRVSVIPQNAFSGNVGYGLVFEGNARDNKVYNTFIGTAVGITTPVPNLKGGIIVRGKARNNYIGATGSQKINVIAGNIGYGVTLTKTSSGNVVANNNIGRGREGLPVPNSKGTVLNKGKKNVVKNNNTN